MNSSNSSPHIELDAFWPYQVTVLADQVSRYTLNIVKSVVDLNQSQWRVLAAVADKPGCTAAEVTAVTPMDKTIVSRAVASLIEQGFIAKRTNSSDKRRSSLRLTRHGAQCYRQIAEILNDKMVASFEGDMTPASMVSLLKAYSERMGQLAPSETETNAL